MQKRSPHTSRPCPSGTAPVCRICRSTTAVAAFQTIGTSLYWRCHDCQGTFIDESCLPDTESELAQYRLHRNAIADPGYRAFLNRLAAPLLARLKAPAEGLDYGCGPGPALAQMLTEAGHPMRVYDPFFAPDAAALQRTYDFITCTETAEHFHQPAGEFERLDRLLRPGGQLALMTCFQTDDDKFRDWHYRRDPTHVAFYRAETFRHLAARHDWQCEIPVANVVLMKKKARVS